MSYTPRNISDGPSDPYEAYKQYVPASISIEKVDKIEFNKTVNKTTNINIPAEDPTAAIIRAFGEFLNNAVSAVKNALFFFWDDRSVNTKSPFGPIEKAIKTIIQQ